jgi:hypothetical protein
MSTDFFKSIIQKLFPKAQAPHLPKVLLNEVLKRNDAYRKAYFDWLNSGDYQALASQIQEAYWKKRAKEESPWQVHLLQMPQANGFAVTYSSLVSPKVFQYFFDFLKDRVLNMDYYLANADKKMIDKGDYVESVEKYYLKPNFDAQNTEQPFEQRYGNIAIDYILVNEQPSYIKLTASIYSDRLFTKAASFDELIVQLFD